MTTTFADRLLHWWDSDGRKDLPWQVDKTPYRVWLSEIMLQQTQVSTVIPYFNRFVQQLPDVPTLARADLNTVLHLWTGLGYYARARNLHRTAQLLTRDHHDELPHDIGALIALPGIGRSTAHAIATIAQGQRAAILDGNVKRVLTRWHGIVEWPGRPAVERALWKLADELTPHTRAADYTQAIMDLGATCCTRGRPQCARCPVTDDCRARQQARTGAIPARKPRRALPERATRMLIIEDTDGAVLLERRPPTGLWGGLWSFPEVACDDPVDNALERLNLCASDIINQRDLPAFTHTFTHFRLQILPTLIRVATAPVRLMEPLRFVWYKPGVQQIGLSRPVTRLLDSLSHHE